MPKHRIEYQILLSSPGDVPDERRVVEEVVAELNSTWAKPLHAVLRLLRWEDIAPGFGTEPQQVINSKLGEEWDIYIGIMHARFGSPTQRFGSGTEEEFRRAHELWTQAPTQRRLMFYFKKALVDLDTIDPDQIVRVRDFKKKLGELGGLYKEFSDASALKDLLRAHLMSELVELHKTDGNSTAVTMLSSDSTGELKEELEDLSPGLFDLIEAGMAGVGALTQAIEGIGVVMSENTALLENEGNTMRDASARGDLAGMRKGLSGISRSMHAMAKALAGKRREYSAAAPLAFESLSTAISMAKAAWTPETADLSSFAVAIGNSITMLEGFIGTISGTERSMDSIPNFAREFSSARLALKREFTNLRGELNSSLMLLRDLKSIAGDIGKGG